MEAKGDAEKLYNDKASLYQKVFIGFLNWGKELVQVLHKKRLSPTQHESSSMLVAELE